MNTWGVIRTYFTLFFLMSNSILYSQSRIDSILKDNSRSITHKLKLQFKDTLGNKTSLPILIIKGEKEGKIFTILAGVHGAEYAPIIATKELKPSDIKGTIIILPITNMGSFYQRTPYINPIDGKNLNRIFPGRKNGTVSEQIADFISSKIIPISDVFLDVHSGDAAEDLLPFVCFYNNKKYPKMTKITKDLCEYSGFEYVVSYPYTIKDNEPAKYAFKQASQGGKIALSFESGKLGYVQPDAVARIKRGFYRIFQKLQIYNYDDLLGEPKFQRLNNPIYIKSPTKGIFYSKFKAGDKVLKNQIVGYITNEFGELTSEIVSPITGIILYMKGTPPTKIDDTLISVSPNDNQG